MKKLAVLLIALMCTPIMSYAQEEKEKDILVELTYMLPKIGMEKKFVEAVKAHNAKFHPDGAYNSQLFYIEVGHEAGWFVWAMGTFTYTDLDGAPGQGEHADDWAKRVAPYVAEYGRTEIWEYAKGLSNSNGKDEPMQSLWVLDIESGEYYRFKSFMEKVKKIHEDKNEEIQVWFNQFDTGENRDVALSFSMENWASLDKDDWKMSEAFDAEYGEGAWENALKEWRAVVASRTQAIWQDVD